jgi:hypothetical protein
MHFSRKRLTLIVAKSAIHIRLLAVFKIIYYSLRTVVIDEPGGKRNKIKIKSSEHLHSLRTSKLPVWDIW